MLTALSLGTLLALAALVLRVHSWTTETSLVSWSSIPSFHLPQLETDDVSRDTVDLVSRYEAYALPELTPLVATQGPSRRPQALPSFKRVHKTINILDEALAPTRLGGDSEDGQHWREVRGSIEIKMDPEIRVSAVTESRLEMTAFLALAERAFSDLAIAQSNIPTTAPERFAEAAQEAPAEAKQMAHVQDAVSVQLAQAADAEPEFFEYENPVQEVSALAAEGKAEAVVNTRPTAGPGHEEVTTQAEATNEEEIQAFVINQIAEERKSTPKGPTLAQASVPAKKKAPGTQPKAAPVTTQEASAMKVSNHTRAMVKLSALSVSLGSGVRDLKNYELRAKDHAVEVFEDKGRGIVEMSENLNGGSSERSFVLLHKNHLPTHVDVPFVAGQLELAIPAITVESLQRYKRDDRKTPTGYVLVELDDETEDASLDGAKTLQHFLDTDLREVNDGTHRYVFFAGVEVGNRLLSFKKANGKLVHKIIHVHEQELSFDPNLYGPSRDVELALFEEKLLAATATELVVAADQLSHTFTGVKSQKLATNIHKIRSGGVSLGGRQYLTLGHSAEEIFVGTSGVGRVEVPSESFAREVIKQFNIDGNASACIIQLNLDAPVKSFEVLPESHLQSHVSYGLALDDTGQFFETMGEKTRKLFVMSENQGGDRAADNAKVNIRLEYQDGTKRSIATFCSPNTYLVEQL